MTSESCCADSRRVAKAPGTSRCIIRIVSPPRKSARARFRAPRSTSPLVRQRLDAFLKEHGDKGQSSPDHIRFLTYTTRYNRDYWVSLDGLTLHYERAEVEAQRAGGGASYDIKTKNLTRLVLRETG